MAKLLKGRVIEGWLCCSGTMRAPHLLLRVSLGLLACTVATSGFAKEKKRKKKPQDSHPTVITAVTANAISIREAKADKTVVITPSTEIYVRDRKADVAALQPGMAVNVTLAMDGDKASRISATDAPQMRDDQDERSKKRR